MITTVILCCLVFVLVGISASAVEPVKNKPVRIKTEKKEKSAG